MHPTCPDHIDTADRSGNCYRCAARRRWYTASEETRQAVDELLRRRATLPAVVRFREDAPANTRPGLHETLESALERARWLQERGEVDPPPTPPSMAEMVAKARAAEAPVRVVEVLWDGDTFGWIQDLVAIVERPGPHHPRYDEVALWAYRDRNAVEAGKAVAERLGVPFHAAQPDVPDIDLPRWWDQR